MAQFKSLICLLFSIVFLASASPLPAKIGLFGRTAKPRGANAPQRTAKNAVQKTTNNANTLAHKTLVSKEPLSLTVEKTTIKNTVHGFVSEESIQRAQQVGPSGDALAQSQGVAKSLTAAAGQHAVEQTSVLHNSIVAAQASGSYPQVSVTRTSASRSAPQSLAAITSATELEYACVLEAADSALGEEGSRSLLQKRGLLEELQKAAVSMAADFGGEAARVGAVVGQGFASQFAASLKEQVAQIDKKQLMKDYLKCARQDLKTRSRQGVVNKWKSNAAVMYSSYSYKHWSPERKSYDAFFKLYNQMLKSASKEELRKSKASLKTAQALDPTGSSGSNLINKLLGKAKVN